MKSINKFIDYLLNEVSDKDIDAVVESYLKDDLYVSKNYVKDFVSEDKILRLIALSVTHVSLQYLLPEIMFMITEDSITDNILERCLNYEDIEFRETLLVQLAHIWLSVTQLKRINAVLNTPEAFLKVLWMYLQKPNYSISDLALLLQENIRFSEELKEISYNENFNIDKFLYVKHFLSSCTKNE